MLLTTLFPFSAVPETSIDNWKGAGIRYLDTSGVTTAEWLSLKSSGDIPSGATGEYQQIDGSGTTDLRDTGAIDQIVKIYGDSSHGNIDYRDHLSIKYQVNGYAPIRSDLLDLYGITSLEPFEYSIAMEPVAIAASTGDPAISITVVDHTASPLVVGGKSFDYEIQDNGTNTAEDILREWNYNNSLDATYQGKDPFNWGEFIVEEGSGHSTTRSFVEGQDDTDTLHGVYVSRASADHPGFTRFQSNDGTYYTVPVTANISITNLPNAGTQRLQIYNSTTTTEYYNDDPGATGYSESYTDGVGISAGDSIRVRFAEINGDTSFKLFATVVTATSDGFSIDADNFIEVDSVYASNGIDGEAVTKFSADFTDDEIDLSANSNFTASEAYAFYCDTLATEDGIEQFWDGIEATDVANYKVVTDNLSLKFDNTTTASKRQTDSARIYRDDGIYPVKDPTTSGFGIDINWQNVVYVQNIGGSSLTAGESAQLMAIPLNTPTTDEVFIEALKANLTTE